MVTNKLNLDSTIKEYYAQSRDERLELCQERAKRRWTQFETSPDYIQDALKYAEEVKIDAKSGKTSTDEIKKVDDLWVVLKSKPEETDIDKTISEILEDDIPEAYAQIMAILSEQFYRFNRSDEAKESSQRGQDILKALSKKLSNQPYKSPFLVDSTVSKEQIRLCLAYIQSHSYSTPNNERYEETISQLQNCKEYVIGKTEIEGSSWSGTLALIEAYLGRALRNAWQYNRAVRAFGQARSYYEKKSRKYTGVDKKNKPLERLKNYQKNSKFYEETELSFIKHRTSMILILGNAWMDIQHGRSYKALYNSLYPAKAMLESLEKDEFGKNYLELLESAAMRWLSIPAYSRKENKIKETVIFTPQEALDKISLVLNRFKELGIERNILHASYEKILCLEYCEHWQSCVDEADALIKRSKEAEAPYWTARSLLLMARVKTRRWYHEDKKEKAFGSKDQREFSLDEVLPFFEEAEKDYKKYIQTQFEYDLYRGEAYLTAKDYTEAAKIFEDALVKNRAYKSFYPEPLNPKIEASCRLRLAKIFIKTGKHAKASEQLQVWDESLSDVVDDMYLHYLAERNKDNLWINKNEFRYEIKIPDHLSYERSNSELRKFLLGKAMELKEDGKTWEEIEDLLEISGNKLTKWRKEFGIDPPKQPLIHTKNSKSKT